MNTTAEYECTVCKHRYKGPPGPTQCPRCNALYVKWLNYAQKDIKRFSQINKKGQP